MRVLQQRQACSGWQCRVLACKGHCVQRNMNSPLPMGPAFRSWGGAPCLSSLFLTCCCHLAGQADRSKCSTFQCCTPWRSGSSPSCPPKHSSLHRRTMAIIRSLISSTDVGYASSTGAYASSRNSPGVHVCGQITNRRLWPS